MQRQTSLEGFDSAVRRYGDREAVVAPDGRSFTYEALSGRVDKLAGALEARIPGERCAVLAQNRVGVVEAMLAAMRRGRANVQLSTRGAVGELAASMETAEAAGLVYDEALAETAEALIDRVDPELVVGIDGAGGNEAYEEFLAGGDPADAPDRPRTDPAESAVFFTSGTTSAPKGILVDQEQAWLAAVQPVMEMGLDAEDRALVCTPWYHMVTSEAWIVPHLFAGATLVIQPGFEAEATLEAIAAHGITGLLAVPTQLEVLVETQRDLGVDLRSLEYIRTGGAIVSDRLVGNVNEVFDADLINTYGLTEGVGNLTYADPADQERQPGTIGRSSYLWEVRVVETVDPPEKPDPEAVVDPGELGEVIGRSLQMTDGYLDRPEATEALFIEDPDADDSAGRTEWLRTGDVARVEAGGYPIIIDRIDNMIVSGGENIYPEEVQSVLEEHPQVREAGVVGVPNETWGEMVAAAVVAEGELSTDALEAHCLEHDGLARYKRPRQYTFVDELPRSPTGTLLRGQVEELFEAFPS
ncbi:MAG: AMP-binding protein [Halobacteriales archaeon]|nr:AMP-binding protein [Halobacteriales archaeon]